jgi:hypothetical protein
MTYVARSRWQARVPSLSISRSSDGCAIERLQPTQLIWSCAIESTWLECREMGEWYPDQTGRMAIRAPTRHRRDASSAYIDLQEHVTRIEQHGFTLADFEPDAIQLRVFKWNRTADSPESIDSLEPFHVVKLPRPA